MRKESTTQVVVPSIVFALVMHLVYQKVFMADLSIPWLLLVIGIQVLLLTAWAFEKIPGALATTGCVLAALLIDGFVAVQSAAKAGTFSSPAFIGAAFSSLLILAALYTSYQLTTSPGYWFAHRSGPAHGAGPDSARQPAAAPAPPAARTQSTSSPAVPQANAGQTKVAQPSPVPAKGPAGEAKGSGASVFRIHHARTGQHIITCPCEQVGPAIHIRNLRNLLADYEPDSVGVVQVTWTNDTIVDIHVDGDLKGSGREHYTLLEFED